jgi:spore germination protein KB
MDKKAYMNNGNMIYTRQMVWLLFSLFTSFAVIKIPTYIITISGRDCWICIILAWVLDVLFGIVYAYMGIRFRGQNYIQHSISIWGKYIGRIPGAVLLLFFILFCVIASNGIAMLISKMLLPRTPIIVIMIINIIAAAYSSKKGLKVLARFCEFIGPVFFVSLVILIIFVIPEFKVSSLEPQLTTGITQMAFGTYFVLSQLAICIILTMYIPFNDITENGFLAKTLASSLGSIIVLSISVFSVAVFGVNTAKQMLYPGFILARIIHIDYYIERLESFWLVIAITVSIITISTLIWVCSLGLAQITNNEDNNSLIYPVALLIFVLSVTAFSNDVEYINFSLFVYPIFPIIITTFEFLLLITAVITKKKTG